MRDLLVPAKSNRSVAGYVSNEGRAGRAHTKTQTHTKRQKIQIWGHTQEQWFFFWWWSTSANRRYGYEHQIVTHTARDRQRERKKEKITCEKGLQQFAHITSKFHMLAMYTWYSTMKLWNLIRIHYNCRWHQWARFLWNGHVTRQHRGTWKSTRLPFTWNYAYLVTFLYDQVGESICPKLEN